MKVSNIKALLCIGKKEPEVLFTCNKPVKLEKEGSRMEHLLT